MGSRRTGTFLTAAVALAMVGGGCAETKDEKVSTGAGATTTAPSKGAPQTTTEAVGSKTLAVIGADYAFEGVPPTVASGTVVSLSNTSKKEVHELVALRVKDGETRPVSALLQLPEAERDQVTEFRGVLVAFPGEAGFAPQGPLTLSQPGRYIFVCTIPTGADPAAYRAATQKPGPPADVPGGPPHVAAGMLSELTVT
ncbi:MAG: hypothetical protein ABIS21_05600 [Acidimicrobiales bacterium]